MPVLTRNDSEIYFEKYGSGFPVLLLASGGMRSNINPNVFSKWAEDSSVEPTRSQNITVS